jgi:hypothetical protein
VRLPSTGLCIAICAIASRIKGFQRAEKRRPGSHPNDKNVREINRVMSRFNLQQALNARFRHVVVFATTAVVTAALLRHTVHVYGYYSPADIRAYALMTIPLVAVLFALANGKTPD